jgi:hypothetical protein
MGTDALGSATRSRDANRCMHPSASVRDAGVPSLPRHVGEVEVAVVAGATCWCTALLPTTVRRAAPVVPLRNWEAGAATSAPLCGWRASRYPVVSGIEICAAS